LSVRRAGPADAREIAEVHVRTWQAAYRHAFPAEVLDNDSVDERERLWSHHLDLGVVAWVAEAEGRIVGFVSVGDSRTETEAGELYAIYVLPEAWGTGAARELMAAAKDWFAQEGYATAMLWVLADNPRAHRFYEREGWRPEETRLEPHRGIEVEVTLFRLALVGG
jgi:GNAT superfamily N-acetyltransferase